MKRQATFAALAAVALLGAACSRSGSSGESTTSGPTAATTTQAAAAAGDFGTLKGVCGPGTSTSAPTLGVTASEIRVGVFTDMGFTKNPEFVNAAKVFTSWCNAAGGINGRKLVADIRDSKIFEVQQRMIESCRQDFALVGGGAAFDSMGVKPRLSCLLPSFPAQTVERANTGSALQVDQTGANPEYSPAAGLYQWLLKEAYPSSKDGVGIIAGDVSVSKDVAALDAQEYRAAGAKIVYNDLYPPVGVSDWTPYAQSIKQKRVKGLVFVGDFTSLAKLEQVLTTINYKPDWIDANNNAYGPAFIKLLGPSASFQNNIADLNGVFPPENASANPATQQVIDLFAKYAPKAQVTLPAIRAMSAWLLFAKSAKSCGDNLTRRCLYDAGIAETAWTGGGLQAPVDLSASGPLKCFNVEKVTPQGWEPADFKPNTGAYRCGMPVYRYTGIARPLTLADVGKSINDLK